MTIGFRLCSDIHYYNTAASSVGKLFKPSVQTNLYGKNSITKIAVNAWNKIQTAFGDVTFTNLTTIQVKTLLKNPMVSIDKYLSLNINGKINLKIKFLLLFYYFYCYWC